MFLWVRGTETMDFCNTFLIFLLYIITKIFTFAPIEAWVMGKVAILLCFVAASLGKCICQTVALRTNALYLLTTTPNVGLDVRLSSHSTFTAFVGYNPFRFSNSSVSEAASSPKLMHWLGSAEYKYWLCRSYERWFVGAFGGYCDFNVGGFRFPFPGMFRSNRYEGYAAGGGVSCGYQWAFARRWGVELSAGVGYMYIRYAKYGSDPCAAPIKDAARHWVGPVKLALSVVYYIY